MKALLIDVTTRTVREVEYSNLSDMHRLIGGYIEAVGAPGLSDDTLYVDEEGTFKVKDGFFKVDGYEQPLAGNGLLVGLEYENGDEVGTFPPATTLAELQAKVRFLTRDQADAWGKAHASEPAVSFTSFGPDGVETTVYQRFGSLFAEMPRKDGE